MTETLTDDEIAAANRVLAILAHHDEAVERHRRAGISWWAGDVPDTIALETPAIRALVKRLRIAEGAPPFAPPPTPGKTIMALIAKEREATDRRKAVMSLISDAKDRFTNVDTAADAIIALFKKETQ